MTYPNMQKKMKDLLSDLYALKRKESTKKISSTEEEWVSCNALHDGRNSNKKQKYYHSQG